MYPADFCQPCLVRFPESVKSLKRQLFTKVQKKPIELKLLPFYRWVLHSKTSGSIGLLVLKVLQNERSSIFREGHKLKTVF